MPQIILKILIIIFSFVLILVKQARFPPNGGFFNTKADIYAEMVVDGNPSRKTEIIRKTWMPVWNEVFDM